MKSKSVVERQDQEHKPVMLAEVLDALSPAAGERMVDATFGRGGYSEALLKSPLEHLTAYDRDPSALKAAEYLTRLYAGRFHFISSPFSGMNTLLSKLGEASLDGIVFDLGLSSPQIDEASRGFSFLHDGPLDMRMSQNGLSARDVVNEASETLLADIFYHLGEEGRARPIARAIVAQRALRPFVTTSDLSELISKIIPRSGRLHPATRTFQALRIFVNNELIELAEALEISGSLLKPRGRLVVVSFHSLEDKLVKAFLRATEQTGGRDPVTHAPLGAPSFIARPRGAVLPNREEVLDNPRARSARLRLGIRTEAPFISPDLAGFGRQLDSRLGVS